ncbi:MAG: AAA family ATPase [Pseudomonas sp.]
MGFTAKKLQDVEYYSKILKTLDVFDIGISNIKVSDVKSELPGGMAKELKKIFEKTVGGKFEISSGPASISTEHQVFDDSGEKVGYVDFNLELNESEGTKKLIALSAPFIDALENSYILFLDELDARLHPVLSLQIINLFNCHQNNSGNAQLVTATHNTNLLDKDVLRRDQIWLTAKSSRGESVLNSLAEYKVRNDASSMRRTICLGSMAVFLFLEISIVF